MRVYEWKSALVLTLLIMALTRLVWMDLRTYTTSYAPETPRRWSEGREAAACHRSFVAQQGLVDPSRMDAPSRLGWPQSPLFAAVLWASCRDGIFREAVFIRYNQGLFITTIVLSALLSRIVTGSWLVGISVAVMLLSRGRLLASNGSIGGSIS